MKAPQRPEEFIGQRMKQLREAKGWSQREVAERMKAREFDWIQTTVAKSEAGARPIRYDEVFALARVFEEGLDALVFERSSVGNLKHQVQVDHDAVKERRAELVKAEQGVAAAEKALAESLERLREAEARG